MTETRVNIFELADQNTLSLQDRCRELKTGIDRDRAVRLEEFLTWVQGHWLLSINMRDKELTGFLTEGKYKNVYEINENRAEDIKEHLGEFHKPRLAFDSRFVDGEKFTYLALYLGGKGTQFGSFCVVFTRKEVEGYATLAFIKGDSLNYYIDVDGRVNLTELSTDMANRECVHLLALLKHETEIESYPPGQWPAMICGHSRYIEALTGDDIFCDGIQCIRMKKDDHDYFFKEVLPREYLSELKEEERIWLASFKRLLAEMKKRDVKLEVIDED